ncbi:ATP-dependent RNA helicase DeaD [Vibrio mimicus]|nr:ATP-dependent RNA helicase DeaD [Vibrio mimicus]
MLKMGFVDDVTWIMEQAPESAQRVLLCNYASNGKRDR